MKKGSLVGIIKRFEDNAKGPVQGSAEWLALRVPNKDRPRGRIGGSEVATLIGLNPYSSIKQLMLNKQGKKKVVIENIMVHFGSLFEEVSVMVLEKMFNTSVYCKNISLISPADLEYFIFSPDGICMLPLQNNSIVLEPMNDECESAPVLIEIKNPWSRQITKKGVPSQYMPQIQAGLMSIPIVHGGLFIDTQTKLCSYDQLYGNGYNTDVHRNHGKLLEKIEPEPIYRGIILCYGELPKGFYKKPSEYLTFGKRKIIDFGNQWFKNTDLVLHACKTDTMNVDYLPLYDSLDDAENDKDNISETLLNKKIIGILCYKVYDITYTIVYRDPKMISKINGELTKYGTGKLDSDEDYIPRKRKRYDEPNNALMPDIEFDYSTDGSEKKEEFNYDTESSS